ncbi:MAG: OsmC family protein [Candidatus Lokiarchaeota archaeon]|nr:OsmC family protein [Candidatus Lokiarchaeota archaeon]
MIIISDDIKTKVGIKLDESESQMIFKCDLGNLKVKDCYIDEEHHEEVDMLGPNPSRLLALGVLGCLSASFIFCLKKRNFKLDDFAAEAEVVITRNEKGFWRIKKIDVNILPKITDPDALKRAKQCLKPLKDGVSYFEQYCIVTQSVRSGIEVNVNLDL